MLGLNIFNIKKRRENKMTTLNPELLKKQNLSKQRMKQLYIAYDEIDALRLPECPTPDDELADAIT